MVWGDTSTLLVSNENLGMNYANFMSTQRLNLQNLLVTG